jgi:hypothetical protein
MKRQQRVSHVVALVVIGICALATPGFAQEWSALVGFQDTPGAAGGAGAGDGISPLRPDQPSVCAEQPPNRLGAIGDSLSDEYFEQDYDYARSWTELLVEERGLTYGPTATEAGQPGGTWGEPRRTGYEDNWARYGATTDDALATGQHTGLADGVVNRGVSHATIYLGGNDFSPWAGAYDEIYSGAWSQAEIDRWIAGRIANLETILDVVQPAGVSLVLLDTWDVSVMPGVQLYYPDPVRRETVATAVGQFGAEVRELAGRRATRVTVFLDSFALERAVFGTNLEPRATLLVGNVAIDLHGSDIPGGGVPTAAFVHDRGHPNTVLQALWANAVAIAFNLGYDTQIEPLSEEEMLAAAGIPYGGSNTLEQEIGPLEAFVTVFIFSDGFEVGDTSTWSATVP